MSRFSAEGYATKLEHVTSITIHADKSRFGTDVAVINIHDEDGFLDSAVCVRGGYKEALAYLSNYANDIDSYMVPVMHQVEEFGSGAVDSEGIGSEGNIPKP